MRNLFLVLLLANLLFVGWRYWVAPAEVVPTKLLAAGREPAIEALHGPETGADPQRAAHAANATGAARRPNLLVPAGSRCMRVGPLADGTLAQSLRTRLSRDGFDAIAVAEEGQIWVGHWVQLESVASRDEADQAVARLAAGGLPDVYVLQTSPPFSISLGVFRDRARADNVAATAARLGFKPQTTDRFRTGTQYWVSVVLPASRSLPLQALGQESGQILRAEQVNCPTSSLGYPRGGN